MSPLGRQWFSLEQYDPASLRRDPETMGEIHRLMLDGTRRAAPVLDAFLDAVGARHGIGLGKIALLGFSQGTMLALHVALRRAESVACVLGYSGALVGAQELDAEIVSRPPVMLIHGEADEVVPVEALDAARRALVANGVHVEAPPPPTACRTGSTRWGWCSAAASSPSISRRSDGGRGRASTSAFVRCAGGR